MTIRDIMTDDLITIGKDGKVVEALKLMSSNGSIRHLPVVEGARLVGIVSERDILSAVGPWREMDKQYVALTLQRPISSIMTKEVQTASPNDVIIKAAKIFVQEKIGAMPVVDGDRLIGIVSYIDFLDHFVTQSNSQGREEVLAEALVEKE